MRARRLAPVVLAGGLLGQAGVEGEAPASRRAPVLRPHTVEVGLFFKGTELRVSGAAEAGEEVIIVVRGADRHEEYSRKRRWGPVWISSGRVQVAGAPSAWLVFSSRPVKEILSREAVERHQLDRAALLAPVRLTPQTQEEELLRSGFFDLKRSQGLYAERPGTVRLKPEAGGAAYALELAWPKSAAPASYQVRAYFCRGGQVSGSAEASLEVRKVGLPKAVAEMSTARASLYGLLCILAAAAAGFGMDRIAALLGGKRAAH